MAGGTLTISMMVYSVLVFITVLAVCEEEIFTTDFSQAGEDASLLEKIINFFSNTFSLVGDLTQFVVIGTLGCLGGFWYTLLLLTNGLGWFLILLSVGTGGGVP